MHATAQQVIDMLLQYRAIIIVAARCYDLFMFCAKHVPLQLLQGETYKAMNRPKASDKS